MPHLPTLTQLAGELDRAAEEAASDPCRSAEEAVHLLRFAADLRHLSHLTGDIPMGAVADRIHQYKQALIAANARADAAVADLQKSQADAQRLAELQASGQILDPADNAALAEPVPGADATSPANGPQLPQDGGNAPGATVVPPPAPEGPAAPQTLALDASGNPVPA